LRGSDANTDIPVKQYAVHPSFFSERSQQLDRRRTIFAELQRVNDPRRKALQHQLNDLDAKLAHNDVGLLIVDELLHPRVSTSLMPICPEESVQILEVNGSSGPTSEGVRIVTTTRQGLLVSHGDERPHEVRLRGTPGMVLFGMPVVGDDGAIRGICSCSLPDTDQNGLQRFSVTPLGRLTELIQWAFQ
jgi:hypothetical protein